MQLCGEFMCLKTKTFLFTDHGLKHIKSNTAIAFGINQKAHSWL